MHPINDILLDDGKRTDFLSKSKAQSRFRKLNRFLVINLPAPFLLEGNVNDKERLKKRKSEYNKKYHASEKGKATKKRYYHNNKAKCIAWHRKWDKKNPERCEEYRKRYMSSDKGRARDKRYAQYLKKYFPLKLLAKDRANTAVKSGKLKRKIRCELCKKKISLQKHHDDYNKPLEVKWLCHRCHISLHKRGDK